jgi:hypothetical protein
MASDKEEKTTSLKEYFVAKPQVREFIRDQKEYHKRNGVKVKIKKFPINYNI